MKKLLWIGGAVVVLAVAAGVYFLASNLNSLVAAAIEDHGGAVTETRVSVSGVDITLREGRGSIQGVRVASPKGYHARDAFSLADITIDLDVASLREDPIVIDEIRIRAPEIHAEFTEQGTSNVDELRKRVQSYSASRSGDGPGPQKRLRIKRFVLEKGRVEVDASALGVEPRTLTLAEIRLDDVGGAQGVPPEEAAKIILTAIGKRTATEIARSEVQNQIEKHLGDSISEKAKDFLDGLGN